MTTTNKLDLRTCPLPQLCEWVAVNIMGCAKVPDSRDLYDMTFNGHSYQAQPVQFFRSLDAVAAVEQMGPKDWRFAIYIGTKGKVMVLAFRNCFMSAPEFQVEAPTEPEARLRAVALAWDAEKEGR